MKRVIIILLLIFFCVAGVFAQSEWEGRVARGGSQDFPTEGFYAASNSFPRNSIVTVTNPATGKTVRVVISRGLSDGSLFMTLSADASRSLGLDGTFPATMKAKPVVIPGVSDQSIGSELPFAQDPDINPSASAGDPNAFVFNNQANAQNIHPERVDTRTIVVTTTTIPSNATNLVPAVSIPVATASSERDPASDSAADSIPSEIISKTAKPAGSEPPPVQIDGGQAANAAIIQSTDPISVAASSEDPAQAALLAGQPAATAHDTRSNPAASIAPVPSKGGILNLSPANTELIEASKGQMPVSNPGKGSPAQASIAPGSLDTNLSSRNSLAQNRPSSGIASSVQDLRDRQSTQNTTATSIAPRTSAIQSGIRPSANMASTGGNQKPHTDTKISSQVSVPGSKGIDRGIRSMGANSTLGTGIGDVARPDHLFDAPSTNSGAGSTSSSLSLPQPKGTGASENSRNLDAKGSGESLLERQLAGLYARDINQNLFTAPAKDAHSVVASDTTVTTNPISNTQVSTPTTTIPPKTTAIVENADASLPTIKSGIASGVSGNLVPANVPGVTSADGTLPGGVAEQAPFGDPKLATAQVPGKLSADSGLGSTSASQSALANSNLPFASLPGQSSPDASNPWLEGGSNVAGIEPSLPVAQLFPDQIPQSSFAGTAPGLALVPEKSDLPLVALKISPAQAEAGFNTLAAQPNGENSLAQLPVAGTQAAGVAESGLSSVRPVQTVVSLEPADYRPPQIKIPSSDSLASQTPGSSLSGDPLLAEAQVGKTKTAEAALPGTTPPALAAGDPNLAEARPGAKAVPDPSLAAENTPSTLNGEPLLSIANAPNRISSEALLNAMRPGNEIENAKLAEAQRAIPDTTSSATRPAVGPIDGSLTQAKDPKSNKAETSIGVTNPGTGQLPNNLSQAKSPTAENLLPGQTVKPDNNTVAVTPLQPNLPGTNTTSTTIPASNQSAAEAARILSLLNQAEAQKAADVKKTDTTGTNPTPSAGADEQWAQKNLPVVKALQRNQYYLQVGAFANPRSAKRAIEEVAPRYKTAVLPEKSTKQNVYKVFVGPLNDDEKGMVLYLFRAKGYRDAFLQKGQP